MEIELDEQVDMVLGTQLTNDAVVSPVQKVPPKDMTRSMKRVLYYQYEYEKAMNTLQQYLETLELEKENQNREHIT